MNTKTQRVIDKTAQPAEGAFMKKTLLSAAMAADIGLTGLSVGPAAAAARDNFNKFTMVPSAAAKTCLPNANGRVTASSVGPVQNTNRVGEPMSVRLLELIALHDHARNSLDSLVPGRNYTVRINDASTLLCNAKHGSAIMPFVRFGK